MRRMTSLACSCYQRLRNKRGAWETDCPSFHASVRHFGGVEFELLPLRQVREVQLPRMDSLTSMTGEVKTTEVKMIARLCGILRGMTGSITYILNSVHTVHTVHTVLRYRTNASEGQIRSSQF